MRCKYTYAMKGTLKPSLAAPIQVEDYLFEFNVAPTGCISSISVSFRTKEDELPKILSTPNGDTKFHVDVISPRYEKLGHMMRCIEDMLAFFGIEEIEIDLPEQEWIPESKAEEDKIKLRSFRAKKKLREDFSPTPYDLVARPLISAVLHPTPTAVLTFYRRGLIDIRKEEFIEAIYDFFFVVESLFAQGKTRRAAVREAFLESSLLCNYIQKAQNDRSLIAGLKAEEQETYASRFAGARTDDIINLILDTRGFLHHHSHKRLNIWDPQDARRFKFEAILLLNICHGIAFDVYYQRISDVAVVQTYREIADEYNSRK